MPHYRTYDDRVCAQCGQTYTCRADSEQRCCSATCAGLARRTLITTPCERCGASVRARSADRVRGRGRFCSRSCMHGSPEDRYWGYVDRSGGDNACWRWTGRRNQSHLGYGRISWHGTQRLAHHVAWLLLRGEIPVGKILRHRCPGGGNDWCVNPWHLEPGTQADNARDVVVDGRHWSQTGSYAPRKRQRPEGMRGDMRELVVILPRAPYDRLRKRAADAGISLQELAASVLLGAL